MLEQVLRDLSRFEPDMLVMDISFGVYKAKKARVGGIDAQIWDLSVFLKRINLHERDKISPEPDASLPRCKETLDKDPKSNQTGLSLAGKRHRQCVLWRQYTQ